MKVTVLLESRLGGLAAVMLRVKRVLYLTTKNMFWKGFTTPEETVNSPGCNWQGAAAVCLELLLPSLWWLQGCSHMSHFPFPASLRAELWQVPVRAVELCTKSAPLKPPIALPRKPNTGACS